MYSYTLGAVIYTDHYITNRVKSWELAAQYNYHGHRPSVASGMCKHQFVVCIQDVVH